jgi:rhamnogalacturonan endolyase
MKRLSTGTFAAALLITGCAGGSSSDDSGYSSTTDSPSSSASQASSQSSSVASTLTYNDTDETETSQSIYKNAGSRIVEYLDRGLIAVKSGGGWFLSWRLLGPEYGSNIAFNVYKGDKLLNSSPITDSTNYQDDSDGDGTYTVRAVFDGKRVLAKSKAALKLANGYLEIPLKAASSDYYVQHAWAADLDGDGQFEFVVSRLPGDKTSNPCYLEAYKLDGSFLWRVDMGVSSYTRDTTGIGANDAAPAAISGFGNIAGYRNDDMVTVYDLDSDGKAEVLVRTATGTTFADGKVITSASSQDQFISVIQGSTGKEITRTAVPSDFLAHGPVGGQFGVGYFDGVHPSLVTQLVVRGVPAKKGIFHFMVVAWDFDGKTLSQKWKWLADASGTTAERSHQIRVVDVDGDGKDEFAAGNYLLNSDGTLRYVIDGAGHGDRFHIGKFDPSRTGLQGFGIQQSELNVWSKFPWYYYDAVTGTRLTTGKHLDYTPSTAADEALWDVGRGTAADIDPRHPGYEFWGALSDLTLPAAGVWNVDGTKVSTKVPSVNFRIWWDGDVGAELLDGTVIDKWNPDTETTTRLFEPAGVVSSWRSAPPFYGDVLGDWREEVLLETTDHTALRLFSTTIPSNRRFYTLAHNPEYRLGFTVRGYLQSLLVDYYLGYDMTDPPKPAIRVVGQAAAS